MRLLLGLCPRHETACHVCHHQQSRKTQSRYTPSLQDEFTVCKQQLLKANTCKWPNLRCCICSGMKAKRGLFEQEYTRQLKQVHMAEFLNIKQCNKPVIGRSLRRIVQSGRPQRIMCGAAKYMASLMCVSNPAAYWFLGKGRQFGSSGSSSALRDGSSQIYMRRHVLNAQLAVKARCLSYCAIQTQT